MRVRAKKYLGQHFLQDELLAQEIVNTLPYEKNINVLEVGPGMGVLTEIMLKKSTIDLFCIELDKDSVNYLQSKFDKINIINGDFLKHNLSSLFLQKPFYLIGNFPYNISSQIFFKVLENRDRIIQCSGLIQKEVALRICSQCGKKTYGILSVLLQTFYNMEYLKTVNAEVFYPKPKVESAIIRMKRNNRTKLNCNEYLFKLIVKTAFNHRRKQLHNSLKCLFNNNVNFNDAIFSKRPEQLSVEDFISLTSYLENYVGN